MTLLDFSYTIAISLMIALPLALAIFLRRRYRAPWWLFLVGAATFIASQVWHLPLNNWLADVGILPQGASAAGSDLLQTALILGLSAGFSETLARVIAFALLFRAGKAQRWEEGVMVGLGHGGIEAMIVGAVLTAATLSSLAALRGTDLSTLNLSPEQMAAITQQLALFDGPAWQAFVGLVERAIAIGLHVSLSLLVWYAFQQRQPLYVLLALLYHSAFDAAAVYLVSSLGADSLWLIELIFLAAALPGLIWVWHLGRRRDGQRQRSLRPFGTEVKLFFTALRKELVQQWRTKRVLVVLGVFALFGLVSPLIAYFTPQLLSSLEGAEMFADVIPDPTEADAIGQYIRNITQFGFIIAVLLGMGAVAGEKERGTTAMVLSKPLPRWAFILSKFVAQALVYAGGFLVAAVATYYYTAILFDGLQLGSFLFGNLLLLEWLLVFAAVTLLGSAIARSTGAAAALALAGAVVLLLAGSIPTVGPLAPSGLVGWASQLGLATEVASNWGAVAANAVLIVVTVLGAVAAFEVQEL
jgi:ABC-2 type transport system permease protein